MACLRRRSAPLFAVTPWFENFVDNRIGAAQPRLGAYLLFALAVWQMVVCAPLVPDTSAARRATAVMMLVSAQFVLGIVALLLAVPLWAG